MVMAGEAKSSRWEGEEKNIREIDLKLVLITPTGEKPSIMRRPPTKVHLKPEEFHNVECPELSALKFPLTILGPKLFSLG